MKMMMSKLALSLLGVAVAGSVSAKTLVYCSEGSPENFNPQLYTSGTSVDASAVPLFDRLVDFRPGTTDLQPALAERWEIDPETYSVPVQTGRMRCCHSDSAATAAHHQALTHAR